jgi:hypothetical protein
MTTTSSIKVMPEHRRSRGGADDIAAAGALGGVTGRVRTSTDAGSTPGGCPSPLRQHRADQGMLVCEAFVDFFEPEQRDTVLKSGVNERKTASRRGMRVKDQVQSSFTPDSGFRARCRCKPMAGGRAAHGSRGGAGASRQHRARRAD